MRITPTLVMESARDLLIGVHNGGIPTEEQWEAVRPLLKNSQRFLLFALGSSSITANQRKEFIACNWKRVGAVVYDPIPRGVFTMFSWFLGTVKVSGPGNPSEAIRWVSEGKAETEWIIKRIPELGLQAGGARIAIDSGVLLSETQTS